MVFIKKNRINIVNQVFLNIFLSHTKINCT